MISRRRVLFAGASGVALLGLAGLGVALQPGLLRAPRRPLLVLDERSFSVLAALADRVCPGGGGLPSAWDLEVPEKVDAALERMHPATGRELHQALLLLESGLAGLLLDGRVRPFTRCPGEVQDQILHRWRTSGWAVRQAAYKGLVGLVSAVYWVDRRTWAHLGYDGPPRFGT